MVGVGGASRAPRSECSLLRADIAFSSFAVLPGKFSVFARMPTRRDQPRCSQNNTREGSRCILWLRSDGGDGCGLLQEIPATFTECTGWPSEEECALVTSITMSKEWPLQIRRLPHVRRPGVSAVSIGTGWANFIAEHNLHVGAFLTFEVVDSRRLVVAIHSRNVSGHLHQPQQLHGDTFDEGDLLEQDPPQAGDSPDTKSPVRSEAQGVERPQFRKKLRKTHTGKGDSSRMVSGTLPI